MRSVDVLADSDLRPLVFSFQVDSFKELPLLDNGSSPHWTHGLEVLGLKPSTQLPCIVLCSRGGDLNKIIKIAEGLECVEKKKVQACFATVYGNEKWVGQFRTKLNELFEDVPDTAPHVELKDNDGNEDSAENYKLI